MSAVRIHRYNVDPAQLDDLLARRAQMINGFRSGFPGLSSTTLVQLEDGSYVDIWRWESAEQMAKALEASAAFPAPAATLALTEGHVAQSGEIIAEL
jgi:hypothetical protein